MNKIALSNSLAPTLIDQYREEVGADSKRVLPEKLQSEAEILEASVVRYDGILSALIAHEIDWKQLVDCMAEDQVFIPYLSAANGDPKYALSLARADIDYWRSLRRSGWKTSAERNKAFAWKAAKLAVLPLLLVLLTAILGNAVASSVQNRSFQRQRFFEAKFQRLREGQQRAVSVLSKLRSAEDVMAGWEVYGGNLSPRQLLGGYREEIEQIRALGSDGQDGGEVSSAAVRTQDAIDSYIACLEQKVGHQRDSTSAASCSNAFDLKVFEPLVASFGSEINKLAQ